MKESWHKNPRIVFMGLKYYRDPRTGYYYRTDYERKTKKLLHRDIWEAKAKRKLPEGFVIHHIDHDKENNLPSNLTAMSRSDHQRHHAYEGEWVGSQENVEQLVEARKKASEWHGTPEGLQWHSDNSKKAWKSRISTEMTCTVCEKQYFTPYPTRSKFCHQNCKATALRARRKNA